MLGFLGSAEVRAGHLLPLNTEIKPFAFHVCYLEILGFPGGSAVKNPLPIQEIQVQSLGQEDPLEEEMTMCSSILAWKIPQTEESGGLQSTESQRIGQNRGTEHTHWVGQKMHLSFSITCYRKTWMNLLAN